MSKAQKRRSRMRQTAVRRSMVQTAGLKESVTTCYSVEVSTRDLLFMLLQRVDVLQFTVQHLVVPERPVYVESFCQQGDDHMRYPEESEEYCHDNVANKCADEFGPIGLVDEVALKSGADVKVVADNVALFVQEEELVHDALELTQLPLLGLDREGFGTSQNHVDDSGGQISDDEHMEEVPEQLEASPSPQTSEADLRFLAGLRGAHKQDAVLNLFINRSCNVGGIAKVLDDIEKYFESDIERVASFFGMKFGFSNQGWNDCRLQLVNTAASIEVEPDTTMSVGSILAHIRRMKSSPATGQHDHLRERADKLVRPRRKKHK